MGERIPYAIALCRAVVRGLLTPEALRRLRDVCADCDQPRDRCTCGVMRWKDTSAVYDTKGGTRR